MRRRRWSGVGLRASPGRGSRGSQAWNCLQQHQARRYVQRRRFLTLKNLTKEVGSTKICASQLDPVELRSDQIGVSEARMSEVGSRVNPARTRCPAREGKRDSSLLHLYQSLWPETLFIPEEKGKGKSMTAHPTHIRFINPQACLL
jgi:hypothetical protein